MAANQIQTEATLTHHLQPLTSGSVEGVMQDCTEESVFVVPDGPLDGLSEIRKFFKTFIETLPTGFLETFKIHKLGFVGEFGYLLTAHRQPPAFGILHGCVRELIQAAVQIMEIATAANGICQSRVFSVPRATSRRSYSPKL